MTHEYCRSTCAGEMLTPKSWLSSRALLCSGTPPPTNKLVNLNNLNKKISNTIKNSTLHAMVPLYNP
jgi:hypothetical protein